MEALPEIPLLKEKHMKYIGIDLHSNKFTCCFLYEHNRKQTITFILDHNGINNFLKHVTKESYIMVEASTNTFRFVERIKHACQQVIIANTHKLKLISLVKKKTDKIDAEKLAIVLKMQIQSNQKMFEPVHLPDNVIQKLRSLFTTYRLYRKHISSIKNRIHSIYKQELMPFTKQYIFANKTKAMLKSININPSVDFQLELLFDELEAKENAINKVKEYIMYVAKPYKKQIDILTSMKGISIITAIALIADISEIKRFSNSKKLASYLRSAPGVDRSNDTIRNVSTNKMGRRLSVTLLSQSLNHFRDSNLNIRKWYDQKIANGKKCGKVRMAICRRVFTEIYQMLKKNEYHHYRNERNHISKMKTYTRFLENYEIPKKYVYYSKKTT
jgi:transposase